MNTTDDFKNRTKSAVTNFDEKTEMKKIMAYNISYYLSVTGRTQRQMCKDLGFKENTVSDWLNAKTYPRIDKIEKMAIYFNCKKSSLIERYDVASISTLTVDELGMIAKFRKLNADGKERLTTQLNDMLQLDKYTQEKSTIISA
jgi:transcriptional regulator with XRE-family HTH domain